MSVNSSSSSSLPQPLNCSRTSIFVLTAQLVTCIVFLLPLFVFVLFVGYRRWRKRCSSSAAAVNSHLDVFTFNMVGLELLGVLGTCLFCCGVYCYIADMMLVGLYIFTIISPAQTLFHLLTCVDRYLAVVHPIAYVGLRQTRRVRTRNIIIGCVWMFCIISPGSTLIHHVYMIINISLLVFSTAIASFCSVSALGVLIHPGPGEGRGSRDQSKQRAFHTVAAITAALFIRFCSILVLNVLLLSSVIRYDDYCSAMSTSVWFSLPSSLVLPLLFLHRAGKLPGSKKTLGQFQK